MFRYLKAAFWERPSVPGIGAIPVNALAFLGLMILGFGQPAFWLLGLALEAGYLYLLSTSERFQNLVDARLKFNEAESGESRARATVDALSPAARGQYDALVARCTEVEQAYSRNAEAETGDLLLESNRQSLAQLQSLYLKLLAAREGLAALDQKAGEKSLDREITRIDAELEAGRLTDSLRESKRATREILLRRRQNLARREQSLAEVASDLARIEAQVELARDNAILKGTPDAISSNISLASHLLDEFPSGTFDDTATSPDAIKS